MGRLSPFCLAVFTLPNSVKDVRRASHYATELARRVGSVLGLIRYRGDSFVVERNGEPVARLLPVAGTPPASLEEALAAWRSAGKAEPEFAADLERVGSLDRLPADPGPS